MVKNEATKTVTNIDPALLAPVDRRRGDRRAQFRRVEDARLFAIADAVTEGVESDESIEDLKQLVEDYKKAAAKREPRKPSPASSEPQVEVQASEPVTSTAAAVEVAEQAIERIANQAGIPHSGLVATLSLDRRLRCHETGEVWPNAFRMWKANPEFMTSSQVDRLTGTLYSAAKKGERAEFAINGRTFSLVMFDAPVEAKAEAPVEAAPEVKPKRTRAPKKTAKTAKKAKE